MSHRARESPSDVELHFKKDDTTEKLFSDRGNTGKIIYKRKIKFVPYANFVSTKIDVEN